MAIDQLVLRSKRKRKLCRVIQVSLLVNSLPSEVITDILSRLPTDSILQCRQVWKTWKKLLHHASFAHVYLQKISHMNDNSYPCHTSANGSKVGFGFLFSFEFQPNRDTELYYGEYEDQSDKKLKRINQPPITDHSMVGSCNGLICFYDLNYINHLDLFECPSIYQPSYISNPITREYMTFPKLEVTSDIKIVSMVCGFGYHPSINKFKVVKIYYIQDQPLARVQVYTLGGGSCSSGWRDIGETAYSLRVPNTYGDQGGCSLFGVSANGALHWLDGEQKIVSFDLAEEKFYLLPTPPFVHVANVTNRFELVVLGGCLSFVHQTRDKFLDIWLLRKKGENSNYDVKEQEYDFWTWIKEFSIPIVGEDALPFALTKSGEVLLSYKSDLCCYDPKTEAFEILMNEKYSSVVPHVNTFVSLKALGEKCRSRKRYKANPSPREYFIKQRRTA